MAPFLNTRLPVSDKRLSHLFASICAIASLAGWRTALVPDDAGKFIRLKTIGQPQY